MGGGVDVLDSEARHGGAGIWLRGFNNIFQVTGRENQNLNSSPIIIMQDTLFVQCFTFFSQFVKSWTSMEHDSNWEPKVGQKFSFQIFLGSYFVLFLCEGEEYIEQVAMGRPGDPLSRSERHAVKIV